MQQTAAIQTEMSATKNSDIKSFVSNYGRKLIQAQLIQ